MIKKNPLLAVVIALFSISLIIAGQLLLSNNKLKADITQMQDDSEERIKKLEAKLDQMLEEEEEEIQVSANGQKSQTIDGFDIQTIPTLAKQEGMELISEDELLENFFAEVPTLLHGGTSPDEAPQIEDEGVVGPVLEVSPSVFDLGEISKQDGLVTAKYELRNTGSSDLVISYAFTSCGCTVAPIKEPVTLAPGDSYPLEVSYDPNFYGPHYELGDIEKSITILSNYSTNPFYKVKLIANVKP